MRALLSTLFQKESFGIRNMTHALVWSYTVSQCCDSVTMWYCAHCAGGGFLLICKIAHIIGPLLCRTRRQCGSVVNIDWIANAYHSWAEGIQACELGSYHCHFYSHTLLESKSVICLLYYYAKAKAKYLCILVIVRPQSIFTSWWVKESLFADTFVSHIPT